MIIASQQKTILFTGGGSSGHVTPNIALIQAMQQRGWKVYYIGSKDGIEKELISRLDIPFFAVASGKLRRYFSWQNFIDPFKILLGILQAIYICFKIRPQLVFSKGGFVAFPAVVGGWVNRIPVVIHESDFSPGLANRLSMPFAHTICINYEAAKSYYASSHKIEVTGTPIRPGLCEGDREKGLALCNFDIGSSKQTLLIFGGGLGSELVNKVIRDSLSHLTQEFNVIHLCGKGKVDPNFDNIAGYKQFDYLHDEFADVSAAADIVVSRAGANAIYELLVLQKPHILIPLSRLKSRGDQIINANFFEKQSVSRVVAEEDFTPERLIEELTYVTTHYTTILEKLKQMDIEDGTDRICQLLIDKAK